MKRLMSSGLMCMLILSSALCASEVLLLDLTITNADVVTLNSIRLDQGTETAAVGTDYSIVLLSSSDEVLHTTYFDVTFTAYGDNFPFLPGQEDVGVEVALDEVNAIIKVPYYSEAVKFDVRKGSAVLLQEDISLCDNDGTCEPANGENYLSCLADCPSGSDDDYCDGAFDGVCDPDCGEQGRADKDTDCTCGNGVCDPREDGITCAADCGAASNSIMNLIYMVVGGGIAIIVAIVVLIVYLVKRKKKGKK